MNEKEEWCEHYIKNPASLHFNSDGGEGFLITKNGLTFGVTLTNGVFNFCPFCGKKRP